MKRSASGSDKKNDDPFNDVKLIGLSRNVKYLSFGFLLLLLLSLFTTISVIWLLHDAVANDDNVDNSKGISSARGYWIEKKPLPFARSDHHAIAVDDNIYIIGGSDTNKTVTTDVTIYDTVLNIFIDGPPLPIPLYRFGAAYDDVDRRIYVFGGISEYDGEAIDSVYSLNIKKKEWRREEPLPSKRSDLCGAFAFGKVYAMGGYSIEYDALNDAEVYDVVKKSWTKLPSIPTPRGDCQAARLGDQILVIGGYYDEESNWSPDAFRNEVEAFQPDRNEWKVLSPMKYPRGDKGVAVLSGDRLLVVGGETHNRGLHTEVASHFSEIYSLDRNEWTSSAPLPIAVFRASAATVDDFVYVFGGHTTCTALKNEDSNCDEISDVQAFYDY